MGGTLLSAEFSDLHLQQGFQVKQASFVEKTSLLVSKMIHQLFDHT
jgi:hypothetical protein